MIINHLLEMDALQVWPIARARVEQHFFHIIAELVAVPDAEMIKLVPPQEELFQVQRRKGMIDFGQPLRHPVIISIFRAKSELLIEVIGAAGEWQRAISQA